MDASVRLALVILFLANSASANLQLTPEEAEYELEGVKIRQLVFLDGGQRVTYAPPRGWQYSGGGDHFVLHPKGGLSAEAIIRAVKLAQPENFDNAAMKRLCDQAIASLPGSATHIAIVSQEKNPLLIEQKETFLITIHYECYGVPYARSVMFLNRKNEQVQFQLTSPRPSFAQLQAEFLRSQFSWQNL
jgi:hypothetical protein